MSEIADAPSAAFASDGSAASEAAVRFDAVGMRYGRAPETLKDITFQLPRGSFHFLTGPSGAGKTSLLSLIYLAHRPSRGLIQLLGREVAACDRKALAGLRRRMGVVFQDTSLLAHLSVFDNAALPLRLAGADPKHWRDDVAELLGWVGLGERMQAMPASLSGGERRRLAVARAVVARPELILADEPTSHVDAAMAGRIMRLFRELNRLGATVVVATHDQELVARSGLPQLRLSEGRLA